MTEEQQIRDAEKTCLAAIKEAGDGFLKKTALPENEAEAVLTRVLMGRSAQRQIDAHDGDYEAASLAFKRQARNEIELLKPEEDLI